MESNNHQLFPWGHERRFNAYSNYFKKIFGQRVQKLSVNAGFTCPNRDGSVSFGGCTYCDNSAFNPSYCDTLKSITQQIDEGISFHGWRYRRATSYLAYFQPFSNTYADLETLKLGYEEALSHEKIIGLVIGTRPDCIDEEKLQYISELAKEHYVIIEYGIESCYNRTLERINRGHSFEKTIKSIELTKKYGIHTGGHFIFGLPGESREDLLNQAQIISKLPLDTIKFHQLQIFKNTKMAEDYLARPEDYQLFEQGEYIEFVIDFLERLNPNIVVERFAGEVPPRYRIAPDWGLVRYETIFSDIERRFEERNTYQGRLFS